MMLRYCTNVEKLCVSKVKKEKILVAYGGSFPPALTIEGNKKESMYVARLLVKRASSKVAISGFLKLVLCIPAHNLGILVTQYF